MSSSPLPIYFFVPNLIGYSRIFLAFLAFAFAFDSPLLFIGAYTISFVLDAADGMAARAFNQCTQFGTILDMFTDRAATAGLLVVVSHTVVGTAGGDGLSIIGSDFSKKVAVLLAAGLVFLDVASHFVRMYVSSILSKGHKDTSSSIFSLLALYYNNRKVMGAFCVGQEIAYILCYALCFYAHDYLWYGMYVCAPLCLLKQIVNVQQLLDAMYHVAVLDAESRGKRKE